NGLLAGAFFVFSCAVVPGLRRVADHTFVRAFQTINRAILNGWFLSIFITAPITGVACAAFSVWWNEPYPPTLVFAAAGASLPAFSISAANTVSLTTRLDRATCGNPDEIRSAGPASERSWGRWFFVRTLSSVVARGCLVIAEISV